MNADEQRLLSIDRAALKLGLCRRTVERIVARGGLPVVQIGRRRLIDSVDLAAFVAKAKPTVRQAPGGGPTPHVPRE